MPVKRSLKLDDLLKANSFDSSKITRNVSVTAYSPTTGTCQMSPFASPTSSKEQENKNGPSNGKRKNWNHLSITERKESTTQENDEFMVLLSKVEKSSDEFMEIMQNLLTKVTKQKLFEKKNSGLPNKGSRRAGSAAMAHGPSRSAACGIFPGLGMNPCPLHRQGDSQPLRHQGSPTY
ncbi:centromere protein R isoform X2 [Kogia breviceps]|uniref:centromere protein R isoform X2 n=1 Tax=Kogia breviceps TaxID=27615 RepID=UPI0034D2182E